MGFLLQKSRLAVGGGESFAFQTIIITNKEYQTIAFEID